MATTTNYGWTTPDDTDLVKDGAAAIRTLGSSIDTSFVDLKGGTTGQVLTKASGTDLDFTFATPSSKILQVVNATHATQASSATNTYVDSGLTATITPTSASNNILVIAFLYVEKQAGDGFGKSRLVRASTEIATIGTQTANTGSGASNNIGHEGITYLDSPATTSATTYKIQFANASTPVAGTVFTQVASGRSSITLMEVSA